MIIFAKYGEYDRRELIDECLTRYLETLKLTKLEGEVKEEKHRNEKPYFKDYPFVRFSVSHSGSLVVVAMAETEVGIDVEEIKEKPYGRIVERKRSSDKFRFVEAAEVKDLESFLKVWTKKEAYLKLTGDGLSGLRSSDVSKPLFYDGKPVESTTLAIFDGYVGTVVAESQPIIFVQLD